MAFRIERIKSFLAKRRLPQFGQEANKDTYSVSLLLFQLCEHDKHFIFHPSFEPEAFHTENYTISPNNEGVSFINKKAPVRRLFEPKAFYLVAIFFITFFIPAL